MSTGRWCGAGTPSWQQRAWGAVLLAQVQASDLHGESAALTGRSALLAAEGGAGPGPIEVVVADERRITARTGIVVVRSTALLETVRWHVGPPRVPYDRALLEVASRRRRTVDVVGTLAGGIGSRRTTAHRLLACAETVPRLSRRALVTAVLRDLADGTCSALEHGYLTRVERPHALPVARRQVRARTRAGAAFRDADYDGLVVELDGRAWHDSVDRRDADADRDLVTASAGRLTVRLTWGQVFDRPCWTAGHVARLLGASPRRCGPDCTVLATGQAAC